MINKTKAGAAALVCLALFSSLAFATPSSEAAGKAKTTTDKCKIEGNRDLWLKVKVKYEDANGDEVKVNKISAKLTSKKRNVSRVYIANSWVKDGSTENWTRTNDRVLGTSSWTVLGRPNVYVQRGSSAGVTAVRGIPPVFTEGCRAYVSLN